MTEISTFPGLPVRQADTSGTSRPPRVCIATSDIVGPIRNGGIGTAYFSLAIALAEAGQDVTILYLNREYCEQGSLDDWRSFYRLRGISFVPIPESSTRILAPSNVALSYDAYQWLQAADFDVIHFPEWQGFGYFTALAKHQGLFFQHATVCVGTHSPTTWHKAIDRQFLDGRDDLEITFMERQSVALADVVVSPSQYMLNWMRDNGWELPNKCYVQQYILSPEVWRHWRSGQTAERSGLPEELVFFGRLEERKGLRLFCDAMDRLTTHRGDFRVTFLGRPGKVGTHDALPYIDQRARNWPISIQVLSDFHHSAALQLLRDGRRVAIIPSLVDNLPNTVLECLGARIPFLASSSGGIAEMIAQEDRERVTFPVTPTDLAEAMVCALRDGVPIARPAVDPEDNRRRWVQWHTALAGAQIATNPQSRVLRESKPLVSVCLTHRDRPKMLRQAIASLEAQDCGRFEVVLVDDGSTQEETIVELDRLQRKFDSRGWSLIRQTNRYVDAARNAAAAKANGEYLLFMDDDNYAKPDEISTFLQVADYGGADILSCFADLFTGEDEPQNGGRYMGRWPYLGSAIGPSLFHNYLGDSNSLIRKDVFHRVGGFTEIFGVTCEDWELLARAVLMGFRLEVIPRALYWYRIQEDSNLRRTNEYDNRMRALQPYLDVTPPSLHDVLRSALAMRVRLERIENHESSLGTDAGIKRLADELTTSGGRRLASLMKQWLEYRSTRSAMPASRWKRIPDIARLLVAGRYHRFAHGFGSALRDVRKRPKSEAGPD